MRLQTTARWHLCSIPDVSGAPCLSRRVSRICAMECSEHTSSHEFTAHVCGVDDNDDALTVGFSRDPADEHTLDALIVQRGKDPQEDVPGIQGVYVEIPILMAIRSGSSSMADGNDA